MVLLFHTPQKNTLWAGNVGVNLEWWETIHPSIFVQWIIYPDPTVYVPFVLLLYQPLQSSKSAFAPFCVFRVASITSWAFTMHDGADCGTFLHLSHGQGLLWNTIYLHGGLRFCDRFGHSHFKVLQYYWPLCTSMLLHSNKCLDLWQDIFNVRFQFQQTIAPGQV